MLKNRVHWVNLRSWGWWVFSFTAWKSIHVFVKSPLTTDPTSMDHGIKKREKKPQSKINKWRSKKQKQDYTRIKTQIGMRMMENEAKHKTPGEKVRRRRMGFGRPARQAQWWAGVCGKIMNYRWRRSAPATPRGPLNWVHVKWVLPSSSFSLVVKCPGKSAVCSLTPLQGSTVFLCRVGLDGNYYCYYFIFLIFNVWTEQASSCQVTVTFVSLILHSCIVRWN